MNIHDTFRETGAGADYCAIVGLGNPDRADDGAGIMLASRLRNRLKSPVFLETEKSVEGIVLDLAENATIKTILFIDAADFGGAPGAFKIFSDRETGRFVPALSTHKVPFPMMMEWIQQAGKRGYVLAIQPESLKWMGEMSDVVRKTVNQLSELSGADNAGSIGNE